MAFSGQVPTAGPLTAAALVNDLNQELEELFARGIQAVGSIGGTPSGITGVLFPVPLNYTKARAVLFKPAITNDATPVYVNWSGLGSIELVRQNGTSLSVNELDPTIYYLAIYSEATNKYQLAGYYGANGFLPLAGGSMSGAINMQDNEIIRPIIKDYSLRKFDYAPVAGVVTLDFTNGNVANITLNANVTSIVVNNWPPAGTMGHMYMFWRQTGAFTVALPVTPTWQWPNTGPITITPVAGKTDVLVLSSPDNGVTRFATPAGQGYS